MNIHHLTSCPLCKYKLSYKYRIHQRTAKLRTLLTNKEFILKCPRCGVRLDCIKYIKQTF